MRTRCSIYYASLDRVTDSQLTADVLDIYFAFQFNAATNKKTRNCILYFCIHHKKKKKSEEKKNCRTNYLLMKQLIKICETHNLIQDILSNILNLTKQKQNA